VPPCPPYWLRWGPTNLFSGMASNCESPTFHLPNSCNYRPEQSCPTCFFSL
jgi:hypothetical protein